MLKRYNKLAKSHPLWVVLLYLVVLPILSGFQLSEYMPSSWQFVLLTSVIVTIQCLAMLHLGGLFFSRGWMFYLFSIPLFIFSAGILMDGLNLPFGQQLLAVGSIGTVIGIVLNQINFSKHKS